MAQRTGRGPDPQGLAETRVRFLTSEDPASREVRAPILASWQRARALNLPADRIQLPYRDDPAVDTPLARSAAPVLAALAERLHDQSVSIVLTDADGVVLSRRTGDTGLDRYLDGVQLAPGFSYAERFVGTNGIGTALEMGGAAAVFGHEHYAEHLENLACAAVPIHDPMSGRVVGAMNLTCWRRDAQSLLLALAKGTAEQIEAALLADSGRREFEVLQVYRQTCVRTSGIVFALTDDGALLNDHARVELAPGDQETLLAHAAQARAELGPGLRRSLSVSLPTGVPARLHCRQVALGAQPAGLVVHVRLGQAGTTTSETSTPPAPPRLPGLVGAAAPWQRAVRGVIDAVRTGSWVVVSGEDGTGKLALVRAAHLGRHPQQRLAVVDLRAADAVARAVAAVREESAVVLVHPDALDAPGRRRLAATLAEAAARPAPPWVAVTRRPAPDRGRDPLAKALAPFVATVHVPALRLRTGDLPDLAAALLQRAGSTATFSADALHLVLRAAWPGNVTQLASVLGRVTQGRRAGTISAADLPAELHAVSRRVLSTLESLERDAIVAALADAGGNKLHAARALGVSRATIYRKIRDFGITFP